MISVIVCTYNRSELLFQCLKSLAEQTLDKATYEVIIADNDSTDNTHDIVQHFLQNEPNFRMCKEQRRGANHARNAGVRIATGTYVAFIDDDAIAYPEWLSNISEFIQRRKDVVVFGGPYDAYSIVPKPDWFPPEYGTLYLGDEERVVEIGTEWVTGTNLAVRKDMFLKVGGFNEKLGSVEDGIFYFGEETRLIVDLSEQGHEVYYVPSVKVKHLIREEKMNLMPLLVSGYLMGRNHSLTLNIKMSLIGHIISLFMIGLKELWKLIVFNSVPLKRKLFYALYPMYYEAGAIVECIIAFSNNIKKHELNHSEK